MSIKIQSSALLLLIHTCGYAMLTTLPKITRTPVLAFQRSWYHQNAHIAALWERSQHNNERLYDLESLRTRLYSKLNKPTYDNVKAFNRTNDKLCGAIGEIEDLTAVNMVLDKEILNLTHAPMVVLRQEYEENNIELLYLEAKHRHLCFMHNAHLKMMHQNRGNLFELYHKILSNRTQVKLLNVISAKERLSTSNDEIAQQIRELQKKPKQ